MTVTSNFGVGKRESHDASKFYSRRLYSSPKSLQLRDTINQIPQEYLDRIFVHSSELMSELPDSSVALMVTSPPYNVGKEYDSDLSLEEYLRLLRRVLFETFRVLIPGGRAAINVANLGRRPYIPLNSYIHTLAQSIGFLMRGEIIWVKSKGMSGSCAWGSWMSASNPILRDLHEYILVFSKGRFDRPEKGRSTITKDEFISATTSLWYIPPESAKRIGHPAPFPVTLIERLIHLYTFEEDVILDPFMGSGTTAVAAIKTKRRFVGYETKKEYVDIAIRRIREARASLPEQISCDILQAETTLTKDSDPQPQHTIVYN